MVNMVGIVFVDVDFLVLSLTPLLCDSWLESKKQKNLIMILDIGRWKDSQWHNDFKREVALLHQSNSSEIE